MAVAPFFINMMLGAGGCVRFVPEGEVLKQLALVSGEQVISICT